MNHAASPWAVVAVVAILATLIVALVALVTRGSAREFPVAVFNVKRVPGGWAFTMSAPGGKATATTVVDHETARQIRDCLSAGLDDQAPVGR